MTHEQFEQAAQYWNKKGKDHHAGGSTEAGGGKIYPGE